jgi:magnesium-transporting ATPase (P-type)
MSFRQPDFVRRSRTGIDAQHMTRKQKHEQHIWKYVLFGFGCLLCASELAFFIIYFVSLSRVYHSHEDDQTVKDDLTDVIFCGFHFLGTFVSLSELLARLRRDIYRNVEYDEEGYNPTWWLVSLVSVCVDLGGYLRTRVGVVPTLVKVNALGNLINSSMVSAWALLVTGIMCWQFYNQ